MPSPLPLIAWIRRLLTDPACMWQLIALVILGETVLSTLIVRFVPYTEIDWIAYCQEVEGFLGGDTNYANLKGDTGPLVYPAGFVYIYAALYWLTDSGRNIFRAQILFGALYVATVGVVARIYQRASGVRLGFELAYEVGQWPREIIDSLFKSARMFSYLIVHPS